MYQLAVLDQSLLEPFQMMGTTDAQVRPTRTSSTAPENPVVRTRRMKKSSIVLSVPVLKVSRVGAAVVRFVSSCPQVETAGSIHRSD